MLSNINIIEKHGILFIHENTQYIKEHFFLSREFSSAFGSLSHALLENHLSLLCVPIEGILRLSLPWPVFVAHSDPDVHVRRGDEAEGFAHGLQVDCLHVENLLQGMGFVGANVGLERLLGRHVQEVVLGDQLLQL